MKNISKTFKTQLIAAMVLLVAGSPFLVAFTTGGEPLASNSRFVDGKSGGVVAKKEFNAGEEIYVLIPLAKPLENEYKVNLEIDQKEVYMQQNVAYELEQKLNYFSFAMAIDPKNHVPEQYFYKEGRSKAILNAMSQMAPGKHKVTFGVATASYEGFTNKITITVNATQEGLDKWKTWAAELTRMDDEYSEKLDKE